ncbi:MAG: glutaredoxin family protein [Gammaproteobacteria bacterium]|nr:MAG: glutaredoxin family protein [Gammaproteobacteria bacterium]
MKKYFLIIAAVTIVLNWSSITNFINPPPDYAAAHDGKVILYATSWCGYCEKTRELLNENNIEYHEYDVESSQEGREQYDRLGVKGVPVLLINGEIVAGYDPSKIIKLAGGT